MTPATVISCFVRARARAIGQQAQWSPRTLPRSPTIVGASLRRGRHRRAPLIATIITSHLAVLTTTSSDRQPAEERKSASGTDSSAVTPFRVRAASRSSIPGASESFAIFSQRARAIQRRHELRHERRSFGWRTPEPGPPENAAINSNSTPSNCRSADSVFADSPGPQTRPSSKPVHVCRPTLRPAATMPSRCKLNEIGSRG